MVAIKKNLVSNSKYGIKCPYEMDAQYITVHNTANNASAKDEIAYMIRNNREVSFHFAVDDKEAVQGLPLNRNGWHCTDGGSGTGNRKSIGVEICYSKNGGERYTKAEQHAVELIAHLLNERGWGIDRVKQHNHWYPKKNCPHRIRDEGRWDEFLNRIQGEMNGEKVIDRKQKVKTEIVGDLIRKGDKGNHVKALQQDLIKAGEKLPRSGADGHFGDETEYAVKAFQARHGLAVDGIVGPNTRAKLEQVLKQKSELKLPSGILRRGDRGEKVKQLQKVLNKINFNCGAVDGIYGRKTEDAVRRFQSMYAALKDDGIYGPQTMKYLEKKL